MPPVRAIILEGADGGYAAARALRRRGVPVTMIGQAAGSREPAASTGAARPRATSGWPSSNDVASRGPGVLIPASDPAVEFVSQERDRIPPTLRSFEGPNSAHLKLMDKASLYSIAAQAGVRAPVVKLLSSRDELDAVAASAAYPSLLEAGALAPLPRAVRAPSQHPRQRPRRARDRRHSGARRGPRVARDRAHPRTRDQSLRRGDDPLAGTARSHLPTRAASCGNTRPTSGRARCSRRCPRRRGDGDGPAIAGRRRLRRHSRAWRPSGTR